MLRVIFGAILFFLLYLTVSGILKYRRSLQKLEELDQVKEESDYLDIEEKIALEKKYQRTKKADIDDLNKDF